MFRATATALLAGIVSTGSPLALAQEIEPWRESYYDPRPAPGDLVLPMPCGGAMAFRPVTTLHLNEGMADAAIELGGEAGDYGYLRGRRDEHLSGSLQGKAPVELTTRDGTTATILPRLYYIAKYEVSAPQFQVVLEGCPESKFRRRAFVPATGVTWFDAVAFTQAYSVWLSETMRDPLLAEFGTVPFVRLPTEPEWEFAARGGDAVSAPEFREPRYPTGDEPFEAFEAYRNTVSGKVQPIGAFKPNPLGLHDMLGNVAELTLEPFRLVRQGRPHGRTGGFVARGGHANMDQSQISAATRSEVRFFHPDTGAMVTDDRVGFRVVLATIAIETDEDEAAFAAASKAAASPDIGSASGAAEADALARLEIAAQIESPSERREALAEIAQTLDEARAERNDQRNRAIEALFLAASASCNTAFQQILNLAQAKRRVEDARPDIENIRRMKARGELTPAELAQVPELEAAFARIQDRLVQSQQRVDTHIGTYGAFIATLQQDYSADVTDPIVALTRARLDGDGLTVMGTCLGMAANHLEIARIDGRLDEEQWRKDFEQIVR